MEPNRWVERARPVSRRPSVLIVDDEEVIRTVVRGLLEAEGYEEILEAADGESAIEVIHNSHPEIVILDYMMPRMDGQAVARCIRLLSPSSRVILFTGFLPRRPEWTDSCDAYIEKTDIDALVSTVTKYARETDRHRFFLRRHFTVPTESNEHH